MITPKISVIIPVYNVSLFLRRCLDSLLNQSFQDFEAICVNDGTKDNCGDILEEYQKKDKRIKIITQENQGLSVARNNGLKIAKGEYIYFLDSDDCIHPQLLEYCYNLIEKENADIVQIKLKETDFYNTPIFPILPKIENIDYIKTTRPLLYYPSYKNKKNYFNCNHSAQLQFLKKSIIGKTRFIPGVHFEDIHFGITMFAKKPKTILTNLYLYYYTINPNSIMRQTFKSKVIKDYYTNIIKSYEAYENPELSTEIEDFKKYFITRILKDQTYWFVKAREISQETIKEFEYELKNLNDKGLITEACKSYFLQYFFFKILIYKVKLFFYKGCKKEKYKRKYKAFQILRKAFSTLKKQ